MDFGREDRDKVIQFIIDRYGEDKFVSLGQFGLIWDRTAIKDVGKVLGIPFEETNKITKLIDADTIKEAKEDGRLQEYLEKYPKLFEYSEKIAGVPKSYGVHPCGRAVTVSGLNDYTAIANKDETIVFQGDMHDVEALGVVKIDALGLRTIDVLYDTLEMIGEDEEYISPMNLNFNDDKVLQVFKDGNTEGMFQFESNGMQNTLRKMQPTGLDDLGVANALFRPGSMRFIDDYVARKHGLEKPSYLHEDVKSILEVTYGIIVFQEQLIEIGRLAKLKNPDLLRKATGKKDAKLMAKVKPELVQGLKNRGWKDETINELWDIMVEFSKYSFNKSHSYAYAMIAFMTAFLKVYHPKEFICSLLNSYIGSNQQDKYEHLERIYGEASRLGVKVRLPKDLSESNDVCFIKNDEVVYGLQLVKSINAKAPKELKQLYDEKLHKYNTFTEVLADIIENTSAQSNHIKTLIKLGIFNTYGNINRILWVYENVTVGKNKYDKKHVEKTKQKRLPLLIQEELETDEVVEFDLSDQIIFEQEMLGFPIFVNNSVSLRESVVVDLNTKFTPVLKLYQPATGKLIKAKVKKKIFFDNGELLKVGNHIEVLNTFQDYKWRRDEDGNFYQDDVEKELFVSKIRHIK
ncbi:hypothetical protein [Oceanobacillus oncorhynchi]|uniref:hypothetical protein n=1 Tax=Oceanobacillus oncorhynchi TaxID=545501 RepID=UPI0031D55925